MRDEVATICRIGQRLALVGLIISLMVLSAAVARAADLPIKVTKLSSDVAACKSLGVVRSSPPYWKRNADLKDMQTQALALGADTLLITSRGISAMGIAYWCARLPTETRRLPIEGTT